MPISPPLRRFSCVCRCSRSAVYVVGFVCCLSAARSLAFLGISVCQSTSRSLSRVTRRVGSDKGNKGTAKEPWKPLVFKMPTKKPPRVVEPGGDDFTLKMRDRLKALQVRDPQTSGLKRYMSDTKIDDVITKETEDAQINSLYTMWFMDREADRQKQERENPDVDVLRSRYSGVKDKLDSSRVKSHGSRASQEKKQEQSTARGLVEFADIDALIEKSRAASHERKEHAKQIEVTEESDEGVADFLQKYQEKTKNADAKDKKWLSTRVSKSQEDRQQDYEDMKGRMYAATAGLGLVGTGAAFVGYGVNVAFSFGIGALGSLYYLSGLSSYTDNAENPMASAMGARRLVTPVLVVLIVSGWDRIEARIPALAELHLEPSLFPAILGFFLYTAGKVLSGLLK